MRKAIRQAKEDHSLLWYLLIILAIISGAFMGMVSLGLFEDYGLNFKHFSPSFFIVTMLTTIIMSYKRAKYRHEEDSLGPFLCSLLFGLITQFFFFIFSPFMRWTSQPNFWDLAKMTVFFILPSLLAYLILSRIFAKEPLGGNKDNAWFDLEFYLNWLEMMTNVMTVVAFLELFLGSSLAGQVMAVRGTIWAFYSIVARAIGDRIRKKKA